MIRNGTTTTQVAAPSSANPQKAQSLHKSRPPPSKFQKGKMLNSVITPTQRAQKDAAQNNLQNNLPEIEISYDENYEDDDPKKLMEQHYKDYDNFF